MANSPLHKPYFQIDTDTQPPNPLDDVKAASMRFALLIPLLLTLPALAAAQPPPHALLALIEQHNPELLEQRRLLDATAAAADDADVLALLRRQERSVWRHFKLAARMGARVAPGEEGTGIDSRGALEFSLPLGDLSGRLAVAKERQRQARASRTQAKDEARQRLAYEKLRAALRAQVLQALADEITGLEKQAALLSSQLRQLRMGLALLAGEAWREALGLFKPAQLILYVYGLLSRSG